MAKDLGAYDMIIGRDILSDLGIKFDFTNNTMEWDGATISMQSSDVDHPQVYFSLEPASMFNNAECLKDILDTKYKASDLCKVIEVKTQLTNNQKHQLHSLLTKFNNLFDGTLGK